MACQALQVRNLTFMVMTGYSDEERTDSVCCRVEFVSQKPGERPIHDPALLILLKRFPNALPEIIWIGPNPPRFEEKRIEVEARYTENVAEFVTKRRLPIVRIPFVRSRF